MTCSTLTSYVVDNNNFFFFYFRLLNFLCICQSNTALNGYFLSPTITTTVPFSMNELGGIFGLCLYYGCIAHYIYSLTIHSTKMINLNSCNNWRKLMHRCCLFLPSDFACWDQSDHQILMLSTTILLQVTFSTFMFLVSVNEPQDELLRILHINYLRFEYDILLQCIRIKN